MLRGSFIFLEHVPASAAARASASDSLFSLLQAEEMSGDRCSISNLQHLEHLCRLQRTSAHDRLQLVGQLFFPSYLARQERSPHCRVLGDA
eukprot:s1226_g21.t1